MSTEPKVSDRQEPNRWAQRDSLRYDSSQLASAAQAMHLSFVVLFGSWATSRPVPGPESDVDVAVLGCPAQKLWECAAALAEAFPAQALDIVRLEDADPLLRHEVMQRGIMLWGDPDQFCEYRAYAYRNFVDSADLRALEQKLFEKKMDILRRQIHDSP